MRTAEPVHRGDFTLVSIKSTGTIIGKGHKRLTGNDYCTPKDFIMVCGCRIVRVKASELYVALTRWAPAFLNTQAVDVSYLFTTNG